MSVASDKIRTLLDLSTIELAPRARALRHQVWQKRVFVRGIIEFSNYCQQNCLYCGLRRDNVPLSRYRLSRREIMNQARLIKKLSIGTVVLQAGEDLYYDETFVSDLIKTIKDELGLAITLSLGERSPRELQCWRQAGADRYLLKIETFALSLYRKLRPGCSLEQRLASIKLLQDLGYETGSGLITGLPGQNQAILAEDLAALAALDLDMISLSPFCPHPQTPLGQCTPNSVEENLKAMSITRIYNPRSHIPVTSALSLHGDGIRSQALANAADVIMFSFTPVAVRASYNIYPGKNMSDSSPEARAAAIMNGLRRDGFDLSSDTDVA